MNHYGPLLVIIITLNNFWCWKFMAWSLFLNALTRFTTWHSGTGGMSSPRLGSQALRKNGKMRLSNGRSYYIYTLGNKRNSKRERVESMSLSAPGPLLPWLIINLQQCCSSGSRHRKLLRNQTFLVTLYSIQLNHRGAQQWPNGWKRRQIRSTTSAIGFLISLPLLHVCLKLRRVVSTWKGFIPSWNSVPLESDLQDKSGRVPKSAAGTPVKSSSAWKSVGVDSDKHCIWGFEL